MHGYGSFCEKYNVNGQFKLRERIFSLIFMLFVQSEQHLFRNKFPLHSQKLFGSLFIFKYFDII